MCLVILTSGSDMKFVIYDRVASTSDQTAIGE